MVEGSMKLRRVGFVGCFTPLSASEIGSIRQRFRTGDRGGEIRRPRNLVNYLQAHMQLIACRTALDILVPQRICSAKSRRLAMSSPSKRMQLIALALQLIALALQLIAVASISVRARLTYPGICPPYQLARIPVRSSGMVRGRIAA